MLSLGTSVAGGFVPAAGILANFRTYMSRMVIDLENDPDKLFYNPGFNPPGVAREYLSQHGIMNNAINRYNVDFSPIQQYVNDGPEKNWAMALKYIQYTLTSKDNQNGFSLAGVPIPAEIVRANKPKVEALYNELLGVYLAVILASIHDIYDGQNPIEHIVLTGRVLKPRWKGLS
jgi:hypothetical protein